MLSENTVKENIEDDTPLEKPLKESVDKQSIKKPRKPKTPAQLEQFEKIRLKRLDALKQKREEKKLEASKLLLDNGYIKKEDLPSKEMPKQILTPHIDDDKTDSESDNDIIIVKKKKKPKKKTIIIEESDDEEPEVIYDKVKKSRNFVSQQNKKSVIKIHQPYENYFVS
jgi:hypothetical protein